MTSISVHLRCFTFFYLFIVSFSTDDAPKSMKDIVKFPDPQIGDERLNMIKLPKTDLAKIDENSLQDVRRVSSRKMRERFGKLLDLVDINSDGVIEKQELIDWAYAFLKKKDHDLGRKDFRETDKDGDGLLVLSEITDKKFSRSAEDMEELMKSTQQSDRLDQMRYETLREDFRYYDLNKDNKLNEDEYHLLQHPWEFKYSADKLVKGKLDTYDFDEDGFISLEEFAVEGNEYPVGSRGYNEIKEKFDGWDENQDGKLSPEEIIWGWSFPDRLKEAKGIVEQVWSKTDVNEDGKISKQEALPFYILWCKHALTNEGSILGVKKPYLKNRLEDLPTEEEEEEETIEHTEL